MERRRERFMRTFRSLALATIGFISAFGLTSCNSNSGSSGGNNSAQTTPEKKNRRIVFVFKVDGLMYGNACKAGTEQATKELKGVSVEYQAPDKAENGKQVEIIQKLIADKVDAIVLSPN